MDAMFSLYGLAALVSIVMLVAAGRRRPRRSVDEGPTADPSLRVALDTVPPGVNNQGML